MKLCTLQDPNMKMCTLVGYPSPLSFTTVMILWTLKFQYKHSQESQHYKQVSSAYELLWISTNYNYPPIV
jgi:hypothetical protein